MSRSPTRPVHAIRHRLRDGADHDAQRGTATATATTTRGSRPRMPVVDADLGEQRAGLEGDRLEHDEHDRARPAPARCGTSSRRSVNGRRSDATGS